MLSLHQKRSGESCAPLESLTLTGATGDVVVYDGASRPYFTAKAAPELTFTAGGAPGLHRIVCADGEREPATLTFRVVATTRLDDAGGQFADLLEMLKLTMFNNRSRPSLYSESSFARYKGRIYSVFVRWLRDHVHVLKGMKYFAASNLKDGIDLYRDSQREDGMIWDNIYEREPAPNYWEHRFAEGDFIRIVENGLYEFKRIPVEADVEYLFVEGLYYTWKATGDDGWMADSLDAAIRALEYTRRDPYRWSGKYGLVKRGHTIDTWDFQDEEDSVCEGDPMRVHPEKTRFGVMFGDNTGYYASYRYLAEMLERADRQAEAAVWRERADELKRRLDALAWNGRYYTHHVPEQDGLKRDLGVDASAQVSLSNAYSLNRGLSAEQCRAILTTYQTLRDNLPPGSPGEWYTIYPPFQRGYGDHNGLWQYMNAGVTPIVAGELAHGAFENGFEHYGVDILRRLHKLGADFGGEFYAVYTGANPPPPEREFIPLSLADVANIDTSGAGDPAAGVTGWTGEGENDLHEMPVGRQTLGGVPFEIPDPAANGRRGALGLQRKPGYAECVELPINGQAGAIYFLHTSAQARAGGVAGKLTLLYEDGSAFVQYIVRGEHVSGWWLPDAPGRQYGKRVAEVAWRGRNRFSPNVGVICYGLDNPHPERPIRSLRLEAAEDGAFWAILGITLSPQPVYFPPNPISYGIPDNWAAAAVVYALIEGLAGVVDRDVVYRQATIAPRWYAAEVDQAEVTVAYPESGGYVAYRYRHDPARKTVELALTGSGESAALHILLPGAPTAVWQGDRELLPFTAVQIDGSHYVDTMCALPGPLTLSITYQE